MECSEVRLRMDEYLKDELEVLEARALALHLEKCSKCFEEINLLRELNEVLSIEPPAQAGESFTAGVMEAISRERKREKRFLFPNFSMVNLGASLVLAGLLTIFINIPYVNGMVARWSDTVHYGTVTINTSINSTKDQIGQYFKNIFIPGGEIN